MVEKDRPDRRIGPEVVLIRTVIAVPRDDVEWRVIDPGFVKAAAPFDHHATTDFAVLECGNRAFEVTRIGKAVGPDRPAVRQVELLPVVLAHEAARRSLQQIDAIDEPARKDRDLLRLDINNPNPAYRLNLMSAIAAALTTGVVCLITYRLTHNLTASIFASLCWPEEFGTL